MTMDSIAGIVLCGGQSRRMGRDKSMLEVNGEPLLARTVQVARTVAGLVVVAAAPEQTLPPLDADIALVRDRWPHAGPLAAVAGVLPGLPHSIEWLFALAVDMPFLSPRFLSRLADLRDDCEAVVPVHRGRRHPLTAMYRRSVEATATRLIAAGRSSMHDLLGAISVREVHEGDWIDIDPRSQALLNWNSPEDAMNFPSDEELGPTGSRTIKT